MAISQALFAGSSQRLDQRPARRLPEFAFIGRSNVGKSSLINCLCQKKDLAHTSSTPGKTQLVNHFLVNDSWYLVDLPGYGYAKMGKKGRDRLEKMIFDYITGSQELVLLFVLLDSRHEIQKNDLEFLIKMGEEGIPFSIIFTKCDKNGVDVLKNRVNNNCSTLLEYWEELPAIFQSSAQDRRGREEILAYIESILATTKL